jgi:hypothetical protein
MDISAWRITGIIVSGALVGGAALYAMTAPPVAPVRGRTAPAASTPAAVAYAISLRGEGPLARAQRLAMLGGYEAAARRQVERELARQQSFRGLCFERFTPRGDIVLRPCGGTRGADWQARLRAIAAVSNVDAVSQAAQEGRGE